MPMNWKCLHLNTKLEVIYLCEVREQVRVMVYTDHFNTVHCSEEE
jgi:hypothetical protein